MDITIYIYFLEGTSGTLDGFVTWELKEISWKIPDLTKKQDDQTLLRDLW
jgi:hypothetical protein